MKHDREESCNDNGDNSDTVPKLKRISTYSHNPQALVEFANALLAAANGQVVDECVFSQFSCFVTETSNMEKKRRRPKRIFLIRHGEAEGNLDKSLFSSIPDHAMKLTDRGQQQARDAGVKLRSIIGEETVSFFYSPYKRSLQTLQGIGEGGNFDLSQHRVIEDVRLREQEFANFQTPDEMERQMMEAQKYGRFWYRYHQGESGADVFDRVSAFLGTLHAEMDEGRYRVDNIVIITHGLTMRFIFMRYFNWTVDMFHQVWNPQNCEMWIMEKSANGKYRSRDDNPIRYGNTRCPEALSRTASSFIGFRLDSSSSGGSVSSSSVSGGSNNNNDIMSPNSLHNSTSFPTSSLFQSQPGDDDDDE